MQFRPFDTLSAALNRAGRRPPNTIFAVLALEGARYYVFFSQPDLGQFMYRHATHMVNVAMQLQALPQFNPGGPVPGAGAVAHNERRARAAGLNPYLVTEARARGIEQAQGHAEMFLIEAWPRCVADFLAHRRHAPRRAEIFLSHSPCRPDDAAPSPPMVIDGVQYPESCRDKLYTFFKSKGASTRFAIRYAQRFGSAEALTDNQLVQDFPGIDIARVPPEMLHLMPV